jgi:hypothetical protein
MQPYELQPGEAVRGGYTFIVQLLGYIQADPDNRLSPWPFLVLAGGVLLPFALRGRCAVVIDSIRHPFVWKTVTTLRAAGIEVLNSC